MQNHIVILGNLAGYFLETQEYLNLIPGVYRVASKRRGNGGYYNFVLFNHDGRKICVNRCSSNTYRFVDENFKDAAPVFVAILTKRQVLANDQSSHAGVLIAPGTNISVKVLVPNSSDWHNNYYLLEGEVKSGDMQGRNIYISGIRREWFTVTEGEGMSLWDGLDIAE